MNRRWQDQLGLPMMPLLFLVNTKGASSRFLGHRWGRGTRQGMYEWLSVSAMLWRRVRAWFIQPRL
jgi:hypothetical protein